MDSSAQLWAVVFKEGKKYDKTLVESWKGDMDGIVSNPLKKLRQTGFFSATVAAFIIDGYKYLIRTVGINNNVIRNLVHIRSASHLRWQTDSTAFLLMLGSVFFIGYFYTQMRLHAVVQL